MADRKISDLTALTTPATGDLIPIVDVSEAAAADKNKSITVGELLRGAPDGTAAAPGIAFESDGGNGMFLGGTDILAFSTGGSQAVTIDASQQVGIGTSSPSKDLHIQPAADNGGILIKGTFPNRFTAYTSPDTSAGYRFGYSETVGGLIQRCDADGTFVANVMVFDSSGRVGIGTTSPAENLHVAGNIRFGDTTPAEIYTNTNELRLGVDRNNDNATSDITFYVDNTERARITSSGQLLVGTSTARSVAGVTGGFHLTGTGADSCLNVSRYSANTGPAILQFGKSRGTSDGSYTIVSENDQLGSIAFAGADGTDLNSVAATITAFVDGTPGANDMPGRLVFSTTADGASSPTERMRITSDGHILVHKTSTSISSQGHEFRASNFASHTVGGGDCLRLNRTTNDGDLVLFYQDTVQEGSISVSGTTVSYNGAHLSRWSQLPSGAERTEILRGSVLSNIDEMCEWGEEDNEQLNRMKVSDVEGDKNVSGVFQAWDDDDDTYTNDFYCAMTGDFIIRIAQGVTVERGDLLMSAGDGTAKPQDDDIIRSKTIAKVTSTNVSCTYDDGSYCVPCVLMAC